MRRLLSVVALLKLEFFGSRTKLSGIGNHVTASLIASAEQAVSGLEQSSARILIADDDTDFRRSLERILTIWGYHVQSAPNGETAWDLMQQEPPQLALFDWMMPGRNGLELCRKIRGLLQDRCLHIILLSSRVTTEDIVAGLEAGADDYLTKPVDFPELKARVQVGLRMVRLQEELHQRARVLAQALSEVQTLQLVAEKARERERFLAFHDPLTGLANRQLFFDRLEHALAQARRNGDLLAVLYLDLDGFKAINDSIGHAAGDQVLCEAAQRLKSCLRDSDTIARLGGDEFAVVALQLSEPSDVFPIADKLLQSLKEPIVVSDQPRQLGVSIGVSLFPLDAPDVKLLIQRSDLAMYGAKREGKGKALRYAPALDARTPLAGT
jgi:two-component system, cell cycle response regulator